MFIHTHICKLQHEWNKPFENIHLSANITAADKQKRIGTIFREE